MLVKVGGFVDGGTVSNNTGAGITTIGREAGSGGTVLVQGTEFDAATLNAGFRLLIGEDYDYITDTALGAGTGGTPRTLSAAACP